MKRYNLAAVAGSVILAATLVFLPAAAAPQAPAGDPEPCSHSPICAWGKGRNLISHELRTPDMGFTYAYPFALPNH